MLTNVTSNGLQLSKILCLVCWYICELGCTYLACTCATVNFDTCINFLCLGVAAGKVDKGTLGLL